MIAPLGITSRSWNNCPKTSITWRRSPAPEKSGPKRARPGRSWSWKAARYLRVSDFVLPFTGTQIAFKTGNPVFDVQGCDFEMQP